MTQAEYIACVEKYSKTVYRIAFHYFGNREDAEDVTQEVFVKLFKQDSALESDEMTKAWLIRVTVNACHSAYRNPFLRKRIDIDECEWEKIPDSGSSEQKIVNQKVIMDAVMSLPEKYRIVVYLYYYEEYSTGQISKILEVKETTVQTRLARARAKLKPKLVESFPEKGVCYGI